MGANKLLILLLFVGALFSHRVDAHSSNIATYSIEYKGNSDWVLTISMPLAGLHEALLQHHSAEELLPVSGQYNESLAVDYLIQHSQIKANLDKVIQLEQLSVNLDNHQSNFSFALINTPDYVRAFNFDIKAMSENIGHVNIVRVKWAGSNKKVVLNYSNNYVGNLAVKKY